MHTPAPWSTNKEGSVVYGPPHRHPQSAGLGVKIQSEPVVCFVRGYRGSTEALANARLIAAAPRLLEACKAMLVTIDNIKIDKTDDFMNPEIEFLKTVIREAEGQ